MNWFLTRIELRHSGGIDYNDLHSMMEVAGFSRFIHGAQGRTYRLPHAEYWLESLESTDEVLVKVRNILRHVSPTPAILIVQVDNGTFFGLDLVDRASVNRY